MPRSALLYWICIALLAGSFLAFTAIPFAYKILGSLTVIYMILLVIVKSFRPHFFWTLLFFHLGFWNGYVTTFQNSLPQQGDYTIILEEPLKSSSNWWRFYGTIVPPNKSSVRLLIHIKKGQLKPPLRSLIITPKTLEA